MEQTTAFTLRPATEEDIEFIYDLRIKTMKPLFESIMGWNETDERGKAADELANAEVIMVGEKNVGVIKVIPKTEGLHLHQMQILPEFQNHGIGAELVRRTLGHSEHMQMPVSLYVVKNTPAMDLYRKWGFEVTEDFEHHCMMHRQPRFDRTMDV